MRGSSAMMRSLMWSNVFTQSMCTPSAVGCDRAVGAVERNIGVDPGFFGGDEFFGEDFAGPIVVEVDLELVIFGPEGHHLAHAIDWDFAINIVPAVQHQGADTAFFPGPSTMGCTCFSPYFGWEMVACSFTPPGSASR